MSELNEYKIDEQKNLLKKVNDEYVPVQKLKKDVYAMVQYEGNMFFIDNFGDCYIIREIPVFLFGILSKPRYFSIGNNRIYTLDKYSRMWVHDLEGEILNIAFIKENVLHININNEYCSVTTDGATCTVDYNKQSIIDKTDLAESQLMIFNRSFELIKRQRVDKIIAYENSCIIAIIDGCEQNILLSDYTSRKSLKQEN